MNSLSSVYNKAESAQNINFFNDRGDRGSGLSEKQQ